MALNPRCYAFSEISNMISTITRKNFKLVCKELAQLVQLYGPEADKHLFRCLISYVDFSPDGRNSGKDGQVQLLTQEANALVSKPNFSSLLCYAFEHQENKGLQSTPQLLPQVAKVLRLSKIQEVVFALGFIASSDPDLCSNATLHLKSKLPEVVRSFSDLSSGLEGGLGDVAIEVLHMLLTYLIQHTEEETGVSKDTIDAFVQSLRRDFPRERVPVVLMPLIYREQLDITEDRLVPVSVVLPQSVSSIQLADIISDIGYIATASKQDMVEILKDYGKAQVTAKCIARVLGMMAGTVTGLPESTPLLGFSVEDQGAAAAAKPPTSWDVKVLVAALLTVVPNLNWRDVLLELDYPDLYFPSPEALNLVCSAYKAACNREPIPPEVIYLPWSSIRGQLSWMKQALAGCQEFSIASNPGRVIDTELIKTYAQNEESKTWRSLSLIEILLRAAEEGFYTEVMEIFGVPIKQCPEVLCLGLVQFECKYHSVRQDLFSQLIPLFLANHTATASVIQFAWISQKMCSHSPNMVLQAMADWYMQGDTPDQSRLPRILDVAQDPKVLASALNANLFPFVLDLACLAAKREFLKLDKWITDKIKDNQEPFIIECVNFVASRAPKPITSGTVLTQEMVVLILSCIQPFVSVLKPEVSEKARALITAHGPLPALLRPRPTPLPLSSMDLTPGMGGLASTPGMGGTPVFGGSGFPGSAGTPGLTGLTSSLFPGVLGTPGSPKNSSGAFPTSSASQLSSPGIFGSGNANDAGVSAVGTSACAGIPGSAVQRQVLLQQMALSKQSDPLILPNEQSFTRDVDEKANAYFQAIYNKSMSVDKLLELLKQFKDSSVKKDRDLFVCMLRNMFEEYKFFPQFPEKELQITGQLFGGIIEHGLVTFMSLSLALRYVLDATKKPPGSKMYLFGIAALEKFKGRLKEFSQYCINIAGIAHFQQFPSVLKQHVLYGQQSLDPPLSSLTPGASFSGLSQDLPSSSSTLLSSLPAQSALPPLSTINTGAPSFPSPGSIGSNSPLPSPVGGGDLSPSQSLGLQGLSGPGTGGASGAPRDSPTSPVIRKADPPSINTASINTLLVAADQEAERNSPPEELQDKVHFIFNNLSVNTLQDKTAEFEGLVSDEYYDWVAKYLVVKRASIEPNFHNLYINFLDTLNSARLRKGVITETYRNIKVILQADKTTNNFSDRALLKNLGHWLGLQTLAKNKPILQVDLGVKDLILEAHYRGQQDLLYVVPFVAKILESCIDSKVFKPPNPWTMAIMSVLRELHDIPDLKLNLKFEIEVLCKHLQIEIGDITPPSNLLNDTERAKRLNQLYSQTGQGDMNSGEQSSMEPDTPASLGLVPASSSGTLATPTQPLFHYEDIVITQLSSLAQYIQTEGQIPVLQQYPQLKQYVRPAIEKAIQDVLPLVVDRSIKMALTTTEHLVKKDFSVDPDIQRMQVAGHNMIRHLTAGMAMITCREPLLLHISNNLKSAFTVAIRPTSDDVKNVLEQAATQIASDNTELACAFIQKTATEKSVTEMDKRLAEEYEVRKQARNEGRRYCNPVVLTYQAERMPAELRLQVGGPTTQQTIVYEEFGRCLPGFLPTSTVASSKFTPSEDFVAVLLKCIQEISQHLRIALAPPNNPHILMMRALLEMTMQLRLTQNYATVLALLQKALEGLLEGMNPPPGDPDLFVSFRDCHLLILKMIQNPSGLGADATMHHVTRLLLNAREDIKYSPRAIILLIGLQIVDMKQLDEFLAKAVENGRNLVALSCSIKLVNAIVSAEKRETPITDKDLLKTKEALYRLASNVRSLPESSAALLEPFRQDHDIRLTTAGAVAPGGPLTAAPSAEMDRAPGGSSSLLHQNMVVATGENEDPPGLYEKVEYLLSEWVRHFHQPGRLLKEGDAIYAAYVARLQQQGILRSDDLITRFFRISVEMCVDLCYRTLNDQTLNPTMARAKCYHTMDAFVKLVVVLVRYSGDPTNTVTKINLLNKVLVTVAHVLIQDHESRVADFHQLAYHRFFIMLLNDLSNPDPVFDAINYPVLHAFSSVYHLLRPSRTPGFAYSWLELISHRTFIAKLLLHTPQQKGWPLFHQLLVDLFKFLSPFLRNAELTKPTQLLYKGTLRVLLVLLHDFPEFLCDYHVSFCDVIPPNCIQMRNLILSAFPRNMRLPDPFTPNLKVEMLPDIAHAPRILPNYAQHIPVNLKKDLDTYIRTRAPVSFLQELRGHLQISNEPGNQYNVAAINALVLYVGTQAITFVHSKGQTPSTSSIAHTAHMDIFQHMVVDLDTEGRYLFLNAIANQLRYPNSHTHYFSCALLSLFAETNVEAIQEQITRVLLERLIVNRPHPWGLLITFIELIKNPTYNFWKHEFVHCAPEIQKLFESVAKSCKQPPAATPAREESHE